MTPEGINRLARRYIQDFAYLAEEDVPAAVFDAVLDIAFHVARYEPDQTPAQVIETVKELRGAILLGLSTVRAEIQRRTLN